MIYFETYSSTNTSSTRKKTLYSSAQNLQFSLIDSCDIKEARTGSDSQSIRKFINRMGFARFLEIFRALKCQNQVGNF